MAAEEYKVSLEVDEDVLKWVVFALKTIVYSRWVNCTVYGLHLNKVVKYNAVQQQRLWIVIDKPQPHTKSHMGIKGNRKLQNSHT